MSLYVCPVCAVMPPEGVTISHLAMRGAFCNPLLWQGRNTKLYSVVKVSNCTHGPEISGKKTPKEIEEPWNAWAEMEAAIQAAKRGLAGKRKQQWLYNLGITSLTEGILKPSQTPQPFTQPA